ncbi:TIGR02679 family protein [Trujillonella humicola]|uniref:TIGR02679 family protein n=1 Tax=Trujillonella humicola TaxID=3383699 RepID=UPI0039067DA5
MTAPAAALWAELRAPALAPVWTGVRRRLEATGLQPVGQVEVPLDAVAADLLGGILGRRLRPGRRRLALADLDAVLRRSPAAASLVEVMTALGGPLRDRPAEKAAAAGLRQGIDEAWEALLAGADLAGPWVARWTAGLRADGLLGPSSSSALPVAVAAVARVLADPAPRTLGELAALVAGDAHALDPGRRAGRVALRGLAARRGEPPPATAGDRSRLWASADVRTDDVSGTVLVLGWRPPGTGRWAGMMRERAELGLATHLTLRELRRADGPWAVPGAVVHACENPQVVQAAADRDVPGPLVCLQGNPSAAGSLLVDRLLADGARIRYHGDFDWPGLAIAGRVLARGAVPWRLSAADYRAALPIGAGVPLTGTQVATPWDPDLQPALRESGRAVHEEAVLDSLLADLAAGVVS